MPPFAAPLALVGTLDGDANVAASADQGAAGSAAGLHGARAAASSTSARCASAARSCWPSSPRAARECIARARRAAARAARAIPGVQRRRDRDPRRPRRPARARAPPRLALPGRLGPRRRAGQPLRRRGLPAADVRAAAAARVQATTRRRARRRGLDRRCARSSARRASGGGREPRRRPDARRRAGSIAELARRASRACGCVVRDRRRRRPARTPRALRERLRVLADRFRGARALDAAPRAGPARLPRLLPPRRPRPRRRPHAGRGGGARAPRARRASHSRGPLADALLRRGDGDRRAGVGARRRRGSTARWACARAARASGWARARTPHDVPPRPPRASPTPRGPVAVLFGDVADRATPPSAAARALRLVRRRRSRACRRSTSRRRCAAVRCEDARRDSAGAIDFGRSRGIAGPDRSLARRRADVRRGGVDERAARRTLRGADRAGSSASSSRRASCSAFPRDGSTSAASPRRAPRAARACSASASSSACATTSPSACAARARRSRERAERGGRRARAAGADAARARRATSSCASPAADLGEPGCGVWQVRPRLGIIGMLMGWWQVKLSSGCPLARLT